MKTPRLREYVKPSILQNFIIYHLCVFEYFSFSEVYDKQ